MPFDCAGGGFVEKAQDFVWREKGVYSQFFLDFLRNGRLISGLTISACAFHRILTFIPWDKKAAEGLYPSAKSAVILRRGGRFIRQAHVEKRLGFSACIR